MKKINSEIPTFQASTTDRARAVNNDPSIYGAFAEIGAGQEVARFFFVAGKASQTIAKTMSAYDMIYSDEIYGKEKSGRYVCESRLQKMLTKEYDLLLRRLSASRGPQTKFFAFANTVATGDSVNRFTHGWLGVRFQTEPGGPENDLILHVRLMDKYRLQQQEILGVLGVNMVWTVFNSLDQPENIVTELMDHIKPGQVLVDYIRFSGPNTKEIQNQLLSLEMVNKSWAEAALFSPQGDILSCSDALFKKPILVQRGHFRPITKTHVDVLERGREQFKRDFKTSPEVIFEITMKSLNPAEKKTAQKKSGLSHFIDEEDFLDRVRTLNFLGYSVLVSNFSLFYQLKKFFRQYSSEPCALLMSASHLDKLFEESYYSHLEGGIMEGLGRLLDEKTKLLVYPHKTSDFCLTADLYKPKKSVAHLFEHHKQHQQIVPLSQCDELEDFVHSFEVAKMIKAKGDKWQKFVPEPLVKMIKSEKLFGWS